MAVTGDVHVGDVGTKYKAKIQDAGVAFDPSTATIKRFIFKTPSGILERDATVEEEGGEWYLVWSVSNSVEDLVFHSNKGSYRWQGYLEFPSGERYHTNIEDYVVERNLQ